MYYSPGVRYWCPNCNSNFVRFIFDGRCSNWSDAMESIRARKIKLVEFNGKNIIENGLPKWICKECYNCGIIEKT